MTTTILIIINVFAALAIIGLTLMQQSKGDMGSAFGGGGGSSQSMFGSRGAANFLSRTTAIMTVIFFISSLGLAYVYAKRADNDSVINNTSVIEGSAIESDVPSLSATEATINSDVPTISVDESINLDEVSTGDLSTIEEAIDVNSDSIDVNTVVEKTDEITEDVTNTVTDAVEETIKTTEEMTDEALEAVEEVIE